MMGRDFCPFVPGATTKLDMFDVEQNPAPEPGSSLSGCLPSSVQQTPRGEPASQTDREHVDPPCDPPETSFSFGPTAGARALHLNSVAAVGTDERSSSTEKGGGKVMPEFMSSFPVTADIDREKDIALLLKELDILRSRNKKLQDNLSEKDKALKAVKLDLELQERAVEAKVAEQAAALVEEIRSAQRERDEAVMARLKVANEERDDAWRRAKQLEQFFETLENINPEENDMTLQELLNRINNADTSTTIRRCGAVIVDRIHRTQERKKKIITEEMSTVIAERDAALAQNPESESEDVGSRSGTFPLGVVAVLICSALLSQFVFHQG
ncbi:hypothetical protein lerEdw1_004889 [Lerista edwardsae]|nr:hypothetical protein lerEdw1_004889 [Lerista edwardsae]